MIFSSYLKSSKICVLDTSIINPPCTYHVWDNLILFYKVPEDFFLYNRPLEDNFLENHCLCVCMYVRMYMRSTTFQVNAYDIHVEC